MIQGSNRSRVIQRHNEVEQHQVSSAFIFSSAGQNGR